MRTTVIYSGSAREMGYSGLSEQPERSKSTKAELLLLVQLTKKSSQLLRTAEGSSGSELTVEESAGMIVPKTSSLFTSTIPRTLIA